MEEPVKGRCEEVEPVKGGGKEGERVKGRGRDVEPVKGRGREGEQVKGRSRGGEQVKGRGREGEQVEGRGRKGELVKERGRERTQTGGRPCAPGEGGEGRRGDASAGSAQRPTAPDGQGVVGCWARAWRGWRAAGASRELVEWVRHGVPLLLTSNPPTGNMGGEVRSHVGFVKQELQALEESGALEAGCVELVCPLGSVPKRKGHTRRLIHNLIPLNRHIEAPSFHPRTREVLLNALEPGDALIVKDLKAGYHQCLVRWRDRMWLGVLGPGERVPKRWKVIPFGAASAPYLFNRLTGFAAAYTTRCCRRFGARHVSGGVFFDDFVYAFRPWEEGPVRKGVEEGTRRLNLTWGGEEQCGTRVEYLGEVWDTMAWTRELSDSFRERFSVAVKGLERALGKGWVGRRQVERVMGMCSWAAGCDAFFATQRSWLAIGLRAGRSVPTYHTRRALAALRVRVGEKVSVPLRPLPVGAPTREVQSDASLFGWGVVSRHTEKEEGSLDSVTDVIREERPMHINEADAVVGGLVAWAKGWEGELVGWGVDNRAVYWAMAKRRCKDPALLMRVTRAWQIIEQARLTVVWKWIPSGDNTAADQLSRGVARSDWTLTSALFGAVERFFGPRALDLFASRFDKKCSAFVSRWPDPRAVASDAFTLEWGGLGEAVYACPPWRVVGKALRKATDEGTPGDMVMVVPWWGEGVRWWTMWEELAAVVVRVKAGKGVATRVWIGNQTPPPTIVTDLCIARLRSRPLYGARPREMGVLREDEREGWVLIENSA